MQPLIFSNFTSRKISVFIFFVFLLSLGSVKNCRADATNLYKRRGFRLSPSSFLINMESSYFQTQGLADSQGIITKLSGVESFARTDSIIEINYAIFNMLDIGVGGKFRAQTSTHGTSNLNYSLSNSGLERFFMTLNLSSSPFRKTKYAFEIYLAKTAYQLDSYSATNVSSSVSSNFLILGDAGNDFFVAGLLNHKFKKLELQLYLRYRIPPNNLSKEIFYKSDLRYPFFSKRFHSSLGVQGIYSLNSDSYLSSLDKPKMATGITNLYNSYNRSKIEPFINLTFDKSHYSSFNLNFSYVVSGMSTDVGFNAGLGYTYKTDYKYKKTNPNDEYKSYEVEARIVTLSPNQKFFTIDKGIVNGVEKNMMIDVFSVNNYGKNKIIANGYVIQSSASSAIVKVTVKYFNKNINTSFIARGYINE